MKKHYFKRLIAISLAAMSTLSCSQSDREVDGYGVDSGGGLPISFTASTEELDSTRATATTFDSGDQIGIYSTFAGDGIANAEFENVGYKYGS